MTHLDRVIEYELAHGCHRRPTKRMVLELAQILARDRQTGRNLVWAEDLLRELSARVRRAKV